MGLHSTLYIIGVLVEELILTMVCRVNLTRDQLLGGVVREK